MPGPRDADAAEEAHAEDRGVGDDADARGVEGVFADGLERGVLQGEVGVGLDCVDGLAGRGEDLLCEGDEERDRVAADADVADFAFVAEGAQLADGGESLGWAYELAVVAVDDVEVGGVEALQAAGYGLADPGGGVVEFFGADAADFGEEVVGGAGGARCLVERLVRERREGEGKGEKGGRRTLRASPRRVSEGP